MSENTNLIYHKKNRYVILNRAKDYDKNNKDRLRVQARDKYRNLSEEEKNKKREYETENMKQIPKYVWRKEKKLKEYQRN